MGKPMDYTDDLTLQIDVEEPGECARLMDEALTSPKTALESDGPSRW